MKPFTTALRAVTATLLFSSLIGSSTMAATNLVTNGGFEDGGGTFNGWTKGGEDGLLFIGGAPYNHSGNYGGQMGPFAEGSISQTLTTVIGQSYDLSFWLLNLSIPGTPLVAPNSFDVSWGGSVIAGSALMDSPAFDYTQFNFSNLVATTATTTVQFRFQHVPYFWGLDDVSVVESEVPTLPGVPDSGSTLALMGLVLTLVAGVRRRLA